MLQVARKLHWSSLSLWLEPPTGVRWHFIFQSFSKSCMYLPCQRHFTHVLVTQGALFSGLQPFVCWQRVAKTNKVEMARMAGYTRTLSDSENNHMEVHSFRSLHVCSFWLHSRLRKWKKQAVNGKCEHVGKEKYRSNRFYRSTLHILTFQYFLRNLPTKHLRFTREACEFV